MTKKMEYKVEIPFKPLIYWVKAEDPTEAENKALEEMSAEQDAGKLPDDEWFDFDAIHTGPA